MARWEEIMDDDDFGEIGAELEWAECRSSLRPSSESMPTDTRCSKQLDRQRPGPSPPKLTWGITLEKRYPGSSFGVALEESTFGVSCGPSRSRLGGAGSSALAFERAKSAVARMPAVATHANVTTVV